MKTRFLLLGAIVALFSGCAFTPQQANISPTVSVMASNEGQGVSVGIRVVDERPSKSLGRRGAAAMSAGAEITSTQEIAEIVQRELKSGLEKKGFAVVDFAPSTDPKLTVEVRLLEYSTSTGFWTGGVHIKGSLKAVAMRTGQTYEKMYRSEKEERVVVVPTAETNEKWINDALSEVLRQLFDDTGLMRFLKSGN